MRSYSEPELRDKFKDLGFQWHAFHLIGIRSKADKPNEFDDLFYLYDNLTQEPNKYLQFTGTTNPGVSWLTNVMNPKGCAVLTLGQHYNCWALGKHHGQYEAWVQVKPLSVFRDNNKDLQSDESGIPDIGMFGVNVHRASETNISKVIDRWSAGCQVMNNPSEYNVLIDRSKKSGQKLFTHTVIREF